MAGAAGWMLVAATVAALATWLLRRYALARGLLDRPGERRSHSAVTPRGGGMAIVLVMLLALMIGVAASPWRAALPGFVAGLLLVAGIGWWDDHRPLPASLRLVVHALAALALAWAAHELGGTLADTIIVACAALVLINVWNFMDGINGLAVTQALMAALAFASLLPATALLAALALAGACLGFLPFNFPKARIFLGDGGSGALGYLLAGLIGATVIIGPADWRWVWLPVTAFIVDAGLTLCSRILARQRWWEPHAQHLYQALARRLHSHVWVTLGYACFSGCAIALFLAAAAGGFAGWWWSALFLFFAMAIWLLLRKGLRAC